MQSFKGQKLTDDHVESHIFGNITFCKHTSREALTVDFPKDVPGHTKKELEELVHKHGGDFTQAQLSDNSAFVISNDDKCM